LSICEELLMYCAHCMPVPSRARKAWIVLQRQLQLQSLFEHQEGLAARPQLSQLREMLRSLHRTHPRLADALAIEPVSLKALQSKLPRDVVLVGFRGAAGGPWAARRNTN